jgi:hypothetical protein
LELNARGIGGLAMLAGLGATILRAPPSQLAAPSYAPGCFAFLDSVRTSIKSRSGTATLDDQAGREGLFVVRLHHQGDSLGVEAWYDTLEVWRVTGTGREAPNVDGFLGGRYRGGLTADGRYTETAAPFVPPDLAQVADLGPMMEDFFPRLPPIEVPIGREWRDTTGLAIKRLPDGKDRRGTVRRYSWTRTHRVAERVEASDSVTIAVEQLVKEEGELRWSVAIGPLGWTRHLVISAHVPAREGVKRSVQTVIEQDITATRRSDDPVCAGEQRGGG